MLTNHCANCYKTGTQSKEAEKLMSSAKVVKNIRMNLCVDMKEFGEMIGVSLSAVSHYEKGTRCPRMETIRKLKEIALKNNIPFDIEEFFNNDDTD